MASRSTKVTSFRSSTIREMFRSDAIDDFNSGRFSSLIRPISVRTSSPFALRTILNTYRQKAKGWPTYPDEKRSFMRKVDGEISPNVEESPNHGINSFAIADAGASTAPRRMP
jgi:hypothetical protein